MEFVKNNLGVIGRGAAKGPLERLLRSIDRLGESVEATTAAMQTLSLWQVVILVTCVEAYLQDVLIAAARIDPVYMKTSEQQAQYSDVIQAPSLDVLANDLRARWARNWLNNGGPATWIERLNKMGARGYPAGLGAKLEVIWGIRHVIVHTAGVATTDFVRRHPGVVKAVGDRIILKRREIVQYFELVEDFLSPTDRYFIARHPKMRAGAEGSNPTS